jgi:hypothetical protein
MYLILNIISDVEGSVVRQLIANFGLLDALSGAVMECSERNIFQVVTSEALAALFDVAVVELTVGEDLVQDELLSAAVSCLEEFTVRHRRSNKALDSLCSLFGDSTQSSYFRIIDTKKTTRFAIPDDLITATDITDRIGSFVSHGQLIPLLDAVALPLEEFPECCRRTPPPKLAASSASVGLLKNASIRRSAKRPRYDES